MRIPEYCWVGPLLLISAVAGAAEPDDRRLEYWHQWRGPWACGVAPLGDPPVHWDATTNVRWKRALPGHGNSTPIVWDQLVFLTSAIELDAAPDDAQLEQVRAANQDQLTPPAEHLYRFVVMALDRQSGAVRWQQTACEAYPHEGRHPTNSYASASPITDGDRVYAFFGSRGLYCYDFDGRLVWSRDLGEMRTRHGWGEGASPALFGDTLYVNWDHEGESRLVALEAATGQIRWQVARDEPTSWSTPLVVDVNGSAQVIVSATNRVRSYEASSGKLLWECGGQTTNVIPSPVANQDTVFCMSWYGDSAAYAIPLDARGDLTGGDQIRWKYDVMAPYCPSPLLVDNRLYFVRANQAIITVLSAATGETLVPPVRLGDLGGDIYASPVAAKGRIYFVGRGGTAVVLQADPELDILAVNALDDAVDASPAIAGRQMFLRGEEFLYCLEEREEDDREP